MTSSFASSKVFVSLVAQNLSVSLQRRGYAAASQGAAEMAKRSGKMKKTGQEEIGRSAEKSWVPDPVTGYYRPANRADDIDVAELRQVLLKQKISPQ